MMLLVQETAEVVLHDAAQDLVDATHRIQVEFQAIDPSTPENQVSGVAPSHGQTTYPCVPVETAHALIRPTRMAYSAFSSGHKKEQLHSMVQPKTGRYLHGVTQRSDGSCAQGEGLKQFLAVKEQL